MTWMEGNHPAWPAVTTTTLQPDRVSQTETSETNGDVLWMLGGGVFALLVLGFILTRRTRQRISEPVFDPERSAQFDDDEAYVEPLL